ncbi:magnesium-translocating P-type ATPase [Legionella drozanskii]|uniref:Magnesium-transporting ATPase, P-type 1 n=1 Tax=Legionella drozanskii LLAP-1 TaxID=1212489 RepID=A0A0W0SW34_9GAMM|nr:magnesium-translocating P-type ATPase [Legionella drozanskii]KTC87125.1 magnesium transporter [Legionella drozanskii LLAP-1]
MQQDIKTLLTLSSDQALAYMNSSLKGLTLIEFKQRYKIYGPNQIPSKHYRSVVFDAIAHSTNPLVAILIIAAVISAFTGSLINAVIIGTVVSLSIFLDYFQTHRSLQAAKKLQEQVATTIIVLRDDEQVEIPSSELVPGDVIYLVAGDKVPADCLLLHAKDLHVQQAVLTGESLPVEKEAALLTLAPENPAEAINAVFSGSSIVSGNAMALVITTGEYTLFGQIAENLTTTPPRTDFEKGILHFGLFIMKTVIFLVLFVFLINIYLHHSPLESLLFAVALAVGLTPEFLPMIITVTLAKGAVRMSKQNVIVKNLAAIQNFGSIDILCSDKTGTLTKGEMILDKVVDLIGNKSEHVILLAYLNSLFGTNIKNPLDIAVLEKVNISPLDAAILRHDHPDAQSYTKIDEIPFDFERRASSVVVDKNGAHLLITKGAPEQVIKRCSMYTVEGETHLLNDKIRQKCKTLFESFSQQGYRVLAIAYREMAIQESYRVNDEKELILSGFLAFFDPPLVDAVDTIIELKQAGVEIKIITGDNELVTQHLCNLIGFSTTKILLGEELERLSFPALAKHAEETNVFARVSPQQKQRIISALRSRGHVVGYIGDGINDAPSLHSADVGISVSGAVDVAREAADIILLEHNLKVLLQGIIEGRKSFGNVMKYLMMGTSSNFGNMLSMAFAVPFLPFLPMKPIQILLNNLLYDVSQITIPTDNVDSSFIVKPKHWNIDIIKRFMFFIGPISSLFDFITFYVMLNLFNASESLFQTGWFVESLATQTLVIFIIRTIKNPFKSRPSVPLIITVLTVTAIGILLPFTPIATTLGFVPLPLTFFAFLMVATCSYLYLVEIIKRKLMWQWLQR